VTRQTSVLDAASPLALSAGPSTAQTIHPRAASFPLRFHGRRLSFTCTCFILIALARIRPPRSPSPTRKPPSRSSATHHARTTHHHTTTRHVTHTTRPVRRRRGRGLLPAMCRGVRPVGQELSSMSLRLSGMPLKFSVKPSRIDIANGVACLDMSVLLQQHQDDHERPMSRVSTALR
jgi:hypothetical protein